MNEKWHDKLRGGRADKKKPSDFDQDQLKAGIKHEMEHTTSAAVAAEIAMDHLSEDPLYYQKLKKIERKEMRIPKLTELFGLSSDGRRTDECGNGKEGRPTLTEVFVRPSRRVDEAPWGQQDLDLGDTKGRKPGPDWQTRAKAKDQEKRLKARSQRKMKKAVAGGYKDPKQLILPGMEDIFNKWQRAPEPKAQFQKQDDGRQALDQVKGKFMHVDQGSTDVLHMIYSGHTYETLPKRALRKIDGDSSSWWGSGAFKIEDDGTFTPASADWDSSG